MTEAQLQDAIIDLARLTGWRVAHFRPARVGSGDDQRWVTPVAADGAGFPDLVLARPGRVLFVELKSARGRIRPEQAAWLQTLGSANGATVATYVWRPHHWTDGTVEAALTRKATA